MARTKKIPFLQYFTKKKDGIESRYIRIGNSLMLSNTIMGLNHLAYRIYTYMMLESGGKIEFEFPYSKFKKFSSKGGFQKAINELVEAGLIDIVAKNANLRIPNKYRFSIRWKDKEV